MLVVVGFGVVVCAYAMIAIAIAVYIPEMFPTPIRLRGTALAGVASRLSGACVQYGVVVVFATWGIVGVTTSLAMLLLLQAAALAIFGVETRGRSLEVLSRQDARAPSPGLQPRTSP